MPGKHDFFMGSWKHLVYSPGKQPSTPNWWISGILPFQAFHFWIICWWSWFCNRKKACWIYVKHWKKMLCQPVPFTCVCTTYAAIINFMPPVQIYIHTLNCNKTIKVKSSTSINILPQSNSKRSECKRWNSVHVIWMSPWWREKGGRERGVDPWVCIYLILFK